MFFRCPLSPINLRSRRRSGMAHLLCLFVIMLTTILALAIMDGTTSRLALVRNTHEYDRAQYLAAAAVHQAISELEADAGWRGPIGATEFPAGSGDHYSATVTDLGAMLLINGVGSAGEVTRRLSVTVELGG